MNALRIWVRLSPVLISMLLLPLAQKANGAGVTIVTHGQNPPGGGSDTPTWLQQMGNAIENRIPLETGDAGITRIKLTVKLDWLLIPYVEREIISASPTKNGEVIVIIDWQEVAGLLQYDTFDVADLVEPDLLTASWTAGGTPLAELPIHLVGHSRGGSLVAELSRRLGRRGVWVDQVTTLDPHPVCYLTWSDAPVLAYENVAFFDNYYQDFGASACAWRNEPLGVPFVPCGSPVSGATNRFLPPTSLQVDGYPAAHWYDLWSFHSDAHLWYYATILTNGTCSNGEASLLPSNRSTWFGTGESLGMTTGFYYDRNGGGAANRPTTGLRPLFGGPAGSRTAAGQSGQQWPNIVISSVPNTSLITGRHMQFDCFYQDRDIGGTVTISAFLDTDRNPYNDTSINLGQVTFASTGAATGSSSLSASLAGVPVGSYYFYLKITDSTGLIRYDYWHSKLTISNQYNLSVLSSGASAVSISISPADVLGTSSGFTPMGLIYAPATSVSLSVPASASGKSFLKWQRNGSDWSTSRNTILTMDSDYTMTAVYGSPPGPYTYITNNGTIAITGYTGSGGAVTIPSTITGLPVRTVGDDSFYGVTTLTSVTIPSSVTSIGSYAFYGCPNLTSIAIPSSVASIGDSAFGYCAKLTSISVDALNLNYSSSAGVLFDKNLTTLIRCPGGKVGNYTIPNGVVSVATFAFSSCTALSSIIVPQSVTSIGGGAFLRCSSLTGVYFQGNAPSLGSIAFSDANSVTVYYLAGTTGWTTTFGGRPTALWPIADWNYTAVGGTVSITGYVGAGGAVTIPSTIAGLPVTDIGNWVFEGNASITSVTVPGTVTSIGEGVFDFCTSLTNISVDGSNPFFSSVGGVLFSKYQTLLIQYPPGKSGSYLIPNGVATIGVRAFSYCRSITGIVIPTSVLGIDEDAFYGCSLTTINVPSSVGFIGNSAFSYCASLTAIAVDPLNPAYSSLGGVLYDKNQTTLIQCPAGKSGSFSVPNSVTTIGSRAFFWCKTLTGVTIPSSVVGISSSAFAWCDNLESVTIGPSVNTIGDDAFLACTSLIGIYFQGNAPTLGADVFWFSDNASVYYLLGTAGWGTTFGGRPTKLWKPILQTSTGSGLGTNQFGFSIAWADGMTVVVEGCTNLVNPNWLPLKTNVVSNGTVNFSDPQWKSHRSRYYRVRWP